MPKTMKKRVEERVCIGCNNPFPTDQFPLRGFHTSGNRKRSSRCVPCTKDFDKKYRRNRSHSRSMLYAHNSLNSFVKRGKINRPKRCQRCKKKASRIEGHHPNYNKPLEVIWLCSICHKIVHKILSEIEGL